MTAWTASRDQLVRELAALRTQRDAAQAEAGSLRERNRRIAQERDALRRRALEADSRRVEAESELIALRNGYDRVTAMLETQRAEVAAAASALAQSLSILRRPQPVPNAEQNRLDLERALIEPPDGEAAA